MSEPQPTSRTLLRHFVFTLYATCFVLGVLQLKFPYAGQPIGLMIASVITCWVVADSRDRGQPMLHSLQLVTFMSWPIAVPIYLVSSRGISGLRCFVAHVFGLALAVSLGVGVGTIMIFGVNALLN